MTLKRILFIGLVIAIVLVIIISAKFWHKPSQQSEVNEPVPEVSINEIIAQSVQNSLTDGEEIYVNSGLSWDINVPESRLKDAEKIAQDFFGDYYTVENLEEKMILDTKEFINRDLKIVMYDVDKKGAHWYNTYIFDANDGELLFSTTTPSLEGIKKVRSFIIALNKAGF